MGQNVRIKARIVSIVDALEELGIKMTQAQIAKNMGADPDRLSAIIHNGCKFPDTLEAYLDSVIGAIDGDIKSDKDFQGLMECADPPEFEPVVRKGKRKPKKVTAGPADKKMQIIERVKTRFDLSIFQMMRVFSIQDRTIMDTLMLESTSKVIPKIKKDALFLLGFKNSALLDILAMPAGSRADWLCKRLADVNSGKGLSSEEINVEMEVPHYTVSGLCPEGELFLALKEGSVDTTFVTPEELLRVIDENPSKPMTIIGNDDKKMVARAKKAVLGI